MSDTMLFGVLRMPYELAMSDELSRLQFYGRAKWAADEIERLREELSALRAKIESAPVIIYGRDCDCTSLSGGMHEDLIGKRVRLLREDG